MCVKERILTIRIMEKSAQQPDFVHKLGLELMMTGKAEENRQRDRA